MGEPQVGHQLVPQIMQPSTWTARATSPPDQGVAGVKPGANQVFVFPDGGPGGVPPAIPGRALPFRAALRGMAATRACLQRLTLGVCLPICL